MFRATLLLLSLTPALGAQFVLPEPYVGHELVPWVPATGGGAFATAGTADLEGDGAPDGFVVRDQRLIVHPDVDAFTASSPVAFGAGDLVVNDACVAENGGLVLATVGPAGLVIVDLAGGAPTTQDVGSALWDGALLVRESGGTVFGLAANGTTILSMISLGSGFWLAGGATLLSLPANDVQPIEWDGDGGVEFLVSDAFGIRVIDDGGAQLYSRQSVLGPGRIATVRNGGSSLDTIAWVLELSSGTLLAAIDATGAMVPTLIQGPAPTARLVAGQGTVDDRTDLLLTFEDKHELLMLEHRGIWPPFAATPGSSWWIDTALSPLPGPAGTPHAAFGDFDGDGAADLLASCEDNGGTLHLRAPSLALPTGDRQLTQGLSYLCDHVGTGEEANDGHLSLELRYTPPANTAHTRVLTFLQTDRFTPPEETSISNCPENGEGLSVIPLLISIPDPDPAYGWDDDPRLFHILIQPVDSDDRATGPLVVGHLALTWQAMATLELHESWTEPDEIDSVGPCDNPPHGGTPVGGFAMGKRLPPLGPGKTPTINSGCADASHGVGAH